MIRAAALALLLLAQDRAPAGKPNVIVIITDDQGYGDLGVHGNEKIRTPHLDAFTRQSVCLDRFHAMPVCSPTRAGLMTGRYYYRTGVVDTYIGRSLMRPEEVTVAEMLGAAGYRTGIFGKWHLGDNYPLRAIDQGFQEALVLKGGGIGQPSDPPGGDSYFDATLLENGKAVKTKGYVSDVITDGAIRFVEANRDRPFFAYLAYNAPHDPLQLPEAYLKPYKEAGLPDRTARVYGMVTNIDDNLGRLFARLDALKIAENTIVFFMTDNGPQDERYVAGMRGRKGSVFDGGIRVPGYFRWPARLQAGRRVDRIAAHIDLAPTLLEACGVAPPEGVRFDGRSLLPLLTGEAKEWPDRTLFFQWHRGDRPEPGRACAARSQRWKLVRLQPGAAPMLFDMEADPGEKNDVAGANPDTVRALAEAYEAWLKDVSSGGYEPPRIHVGSERENPTLLTRQDWRGAKAGWTPQSAGHWELHVARDGDYEVRLLFKPLDRAARARVALSGVTAEKEIEGGTKEVTLALRLAAGPGRLEPALLQGDRTLGVEYAEVKRLD
jgi:arylsulfatase A-like enzyme